MALATATLFLVLVKVSVALCPRKEDLHPCSCFSFSTYDRVECRGPENGDTLRRSVSSLRGMHIFEFELSLCDMGKIPSDTFRDVHVSELYTYMVDFSNRPGSSNPFEGFDNTLYMIEIKRGLHLDQWNWQAMQGLTNLQRLYIFSSSFPKIGPEFSSLPPKLTHLMIQGGELEVIEDGAFSGLFIRDLELSYTRLKTISRGIFPPVADTLNVLSLRHNKLRHLPDDVFRRMPSLTLLDLSGNELVTLSENVLKPVLHNLRLIDLSRNRLHCDCSIAWIAKAYRNPDVDGRFWQRDHLLCAGPKHLLNTDVLNLTDDKLGCRNVRFL